jgi:hypothetical protein
MRPMIQYLIKYSGTDIWIGGIDLVVEGSWVWMSDYKQVLFLSTDSWIGSSDLVVEGSWVWMSDYKHYYFQVRTVG